MNTFGERFRITSFGESHGAALGVVIDGCPAGMPFDSAFLEACLARRRPGGSLVSARKENDQPEILSGVYNGKTLGTPISIIVRNQDARSEDYTGLKPTDRKGHADEAWLKKFGHVDPRGGGRSSGRETVSRVMGGAVAQMLLRQVWPSFSIRGFARQIGPLILSESDASEFSGKADEFPARFPSTLLKDRVTALLSQAQSDGQSFGGVGEIWVDGLVAGLGQPVFKKLRADLAGAMMSIGATSAVEFGDGKEVADAEGSELHSGQNNQAYGGMRGGISTGERLVFQVTFKPTSSVLDIAKKGRHDPCIVPRAIPVLEAMTALVLADHLLLMTTDKIENLKRLF